MIQKKRELSEIKKIIAFEQTFVSRPKHLLSEEQTFNQPGDSEDKIKAEGLLQQAFRDAFNDYLMNVSDSKEGLKHLVFNHLDVKSFNEVKKLPLHQLERSARKNLFKREVYTSVEGALYGLGGVSAVTAEVPLLLSHMIEHIEQIAVTFGMDPFLYAERVYVVTLIALALCHTKKDKRFYLAELHKLELLIRCDKVSGLYKSEHYHYNTLSDTLASCLSSAFLDTKIKQAIPLLGMGTGAISNYQLMNRMSKLAMNAYKRRFLERKWKIVVSHTSV